MMGLNELKDMGGIIREALLVKLALIEAVDKEPNSPFQGFDAAGKTTRASSQAGQIMTQFGIISFHREGIGLSLRDFILTVVIPQAIVGIKGVAMITLGFHGFINHFLYHRLGTFPDNLIAQITARGSIYKGDDVSRLFFSPMKVKSSSISATSTSSGTDALGRLIALAFTHSEMVRW
jgi:hypothetical protein